MLERLAVEDNGDAIEKKGKKEKKGKRKKEIFLKIIKNNVTLM